MFLDPETSKAKILTSRGHVSGRLDAKNFDLDGSWMLKASSWMFFDPQNFQIKKINVQGPFVGPARF